MFGHFMTILAMNQFWLDMGRIMIPKDISLSKNKDLAGSMAAMRRAARMAREQAILTNTAIIVMKGNKIVRVTAEELRKQDVIEDWYEDITQ